MTHDEFKAALHEMAADPRLKNSQWGIVGDTTWFDFAPYSDFAPVSEGRSRDYAMVIEPSEYRLINHHEKITFPDEAATAILCNCHPDDRARIALIFINHGWRG